MTTESFDPKKSFNQGFKDIAKTLEKFGFKRYKSSFLARIVDEDIFQFIWFHKSAYGSTSGFTVEPAFNLLYTPDLSMPLLPGARLGWFYGAGEKWWHYDNEEQSKDSFAEVQDKLLTYVMPWFEANNNSEKIKKTYEERTEQDKKLGFEWLGGEGMPFVYLKLKDLEKVEKQILVRIKIIEDYCKNIDESPEQAKKYIEESWIPELRKLSDDKNSNEIDAYLAKNIKNKKEYLKITDW